MADFRTGKHNMIKRQETGPQTGFSMGQESDTSSCPFLKTCLKTSFLSFHPDMFSCPKIGPIKNPVQKPVLIFCSGLSFSLFFSKMTKKDPFLREASWSFRLYSVLCLPFSRISSFFLVFGVLLVSSISFYSFWAEAAYRQLQSITTVVHFVFCVFSIKSDERRIVKKVKIARVRQERLSPRRATLAADWSRASRESNQRKLVPLYF